MKRDLHDFVVRYVTTVLRIYIKHKRYWVVPTVEGLPHHNVIVNALLYDVVTIHTFALYALKRIKIHLIYT